MSITRTCRISGKEFTISDQEIALLDKISPVIGGEKIQIPPPTLCPEERLRRRLSFKNFFSLHKGVSSLSGQPIISIYPPEYGGPVYSQYEWWSDVRDPYAYSLTLDTKRPIGESWHELMTTTPQMCLENSYELCENSEYINGNGASKDCYLISNSADNEKCLYSFHIFGSDHIINSSYVIDGHHCTQSAHILKSHNVHYSFNVSECRDSWYIFSCFGSHHLLGCVGIDNGSYQILNQPCSPDDYTRTLERLQHDNGFRSDFVSQLRKLIEKIGIEPHILLGSVDSSGDFCYDSKNAHECYNCSEVEDSWHIRDSSFGTRDSMDIDGWGDHTSLSYDCLAVGQHIDHVYWSIGIMNSSYIFYSLQCNRSHHLFGCFGLKDAQYCIYNRQYTQEVWIEKMREIIGQMRERTEWGEFIDPKYAPFSYNESHANMLLPLDKTAALERGLYWVDREEKLSGITKTIPADRLPHDIRETPDDILNWAILCRKTRKPYKIQKLELEILRKHNLPIPYLHPIERIQQLFGWNNREFDFDF